ncbi:enoyl-CoA hydratase/isomerase family protein [Pseudonocardia sp. C8]|uniref:enoyl-CoA hydratase-related protein n=1 Tax=Pseudonocardia sp. C8 TaxID=2762759 RepID=UPI0016426609|nr:enoyl-CoA hydratase-related protein [Pseudonocardia sp. C8]MBC3191747.1 enoyl-CoA hydratase/isomerase family protein [Pseudonocardia sp. C8]
MPEPSQPVVHDGAELCGLVLRCVLTTADNGSSLQASTLRRLTEELRGIDGSVGAVLLVGTGSNFCTGGDVQGFAQAEDVGRHVHQLADLFHDFQRAVRNAPVPVVAAVQGWAAGAGMSAVLAVDVAVAGTSTRLRPAYPALGFSPDGGMSWLLPRLIGAGRARHVLLTDTVIDAAQALEWGLVSMVVPDPDVLAEAERIAGQLAEGPTRALGRIKQLIGDAECRDLDSHLDAEAAAIAASATDDEGRAGVAAFAARRPPRFRD